MLRSWLILGSLYVIVLLLFRKLGGFRAAGQAIERWGSSASRLIPGRSS